MSIIRQSSIVSLLFLYVVVYPSIASAFAVRSVTSTLRKRTFVAMTTTPPVTKREEDRVIVAGRIQDSAFLRQDVNSKEALVDPPKAVKDPYGWLRNESRTDSAVLQQLKIENDYTRQLTSHLQPLRDGLYDEMLQSIQETDYTTLSRLRNGPYWYYTRTCAGQSYTLYCRAPVSSTSYPSTEQWDGSVETPIVPKEEVYVNVNELAKDQSYCSVRSVRISPNEQHDYCAYATDYTGDEIYTIHIKHLTSSTIVDSITDKRCSGSVAWGSDLSTLYYVTVDSAQRPYQVYRRQLNLTDDSTTTTDDSKDELLFEELNDLYWTSISKSSDDRYLLISTSSSETSEIRCIDLHESNAPVQVIAKRQPKVLYDIDHWNGYWIITSNLDSKPNMRLMTTKVGSTDMSDWNDLTMTSTTADTTTLFDGGYDCALDDVQTFENYIVASGRQGGIPRVWVIAVQDDVTVTNFTQLTFDETAYDVAVTLNSNYKTETLVVYYASLITPPQTLQLSMKDPNDTSLRTILKKKNVPGYNKEEYACDRTTILSRDGTTEIPISMVYRKSVMEEFSAAGQSVPVHLYGYGSYGICCEADFSSQRLPLLNRGMVYVCAHVRGGGEMGRQWYEEPNGAKYLCKKNTFNDFCDVAKWLIENKKLTTPKQLSCEGRSAGGLLIGASINQAPELFGVAILGVPFVDVVCTMIDSTIPLTCGEWEEWGNPNEEKYFDYMMEYSPINNVKKGGTYPSCLLTGGLNDPRVQYWEPSKFAAALRHGHNTETSGPVCLKIDMTAGHFSASDRYKYLKELAFDYAFLLDQLGLHKE